MKKILKLIDKHNDMIANAVFIAGIVGLLVIAVCVLTSSRMPCFGF